METSRYTAAHADPKGAGDARPTAIEIVQDEGAVNNLCDKTILITGCSSGLGLETTRALFKTGARLFLTARNLEKARQALRDIPDDKHHIQVFQLDQTSLDSVRKCATEINKAIDGKLNILICNAGVWRLPEGRTKDGFETQWGVNHLSHFLLFQLIKPALLAASTSAFNSRVVVVSSMEHRQVKRIYWDNVNLEGEYDRSRAYAQSKLANIYMANEIERRYGGKGLHALAVHPGGAATGIQQIDWSNALFVARKMFSPRARITMRHVKSPAQAAATQVWAAISLQLEGVGGQYLEDCRVGEPVQAGYHDDDPGYESYAFNEQEEKECWMRSCEQVGFVDSKT